MILSHAHIYTILSHITPQHDIFSHHSTKISSSKSKGTSRFDSGNLNWPKSCTSSSDSESAESTLFPPAGAEYALPIRDGLLTGPSRSSFVKPPKNEIYHFDSL